MKHKSQSAKLVNKQNLNTSEDIIRFFSRSINIDNRLNQGSKVARPTAVTSGKKPSFPSAMANL